MFHINIGVWDKVGKEDYVMIIFEFVLESQGGELFIFIPRIIHKGIIILLIQLLRVKMLIFTVLELVLIV